MMIFIGNFLRIFNNNGWMWETHSCYSGSITIKTYNIIGFVSWIPSKMVSKIQSENPLSGLVGLHINIWSFNHIDRLTPYKWGCRCLELLCIYFLFLMLILVVQIKILMIHFFFTKDLVFLYIYHCEVYNFLFYIEINKLHWHDFNYSICENRVVF